MLNVRVVAVAFVTMGLVACGAADPSPPAELETEPQRASATRAATVEETSELEPEDPAAESSEAPSPSPPRSPSSSPLCGTGLKCSATALTGGKACRLQEGSLEDVYCCPNETDRIVGGACIPLCGSGLTCATAPTSGAKACRQSPTSTSNVYCCPSGQKILNGKCQ